MKIIRKLLGLMVLAAVIPGCRKEHLQPDENSTPLTWISALINNDSIYYAAGVNNYSALTFINDIDDHRSFGTSIKSSVAGSSYFEVLLNNYSDVSADLTGDLEHSLYTGSFNYEYQSLGSMTFTPGGVTINWYDSTGNAYTSVYVTQANASFQIESVETIVKDGLTYKKATVNFHCTLINLSSYNVVELTNGQAVLLFGGI